MSRSFTKVAAFALIALSGHALAGEVNPTFLATNGTLGHLFELGVAGSDSVAFSFQQQPESIQAMARDINGRVVLHGNRDDGTGVWYRLTMGSGGMSTTKIADTETWYNSFTMVGERMFAVKNAAPDIDQIVELNPFTFSEIGEFGQYAIGIGGLAWVPELSEFIVSDTRTNTFFAIGFDQVETSGSLRVIGHAGLRWGGNGLDYVDGHVYGSAIRGEDMQLVFGEVNLQTGKFEVLRGLGDAQRAGVGLVVVPAPASLALAGFGGVLASRRRRR